MVNEGCGDMKKNTLAAGIAAAAAVAAGASVLAYRKLYKKRRLQKEAIVANETKIISMDYISFSTLEELLNGAKIVIRGQILETEVREVEIGTPSDGDSMTFLYTVSKVKVLKGIKGKVQEGDIIYVKQLGDGKRVIANGFDEEKYFKKDEEYYLFMESFDKDSSLMPYSCLNLNQGSIKVEGGIIKQREITVSVGDMKKGYGEGYTIAELENEIEKHL